jgi:hypothetical protein
VNWSVLAAPKASPELVARLTDSLLAMNQPAADAVRYRRQAMGPADRKDYLALLEYTGE